MREVRGILQSALTESCCTELWCAPQRGATTGFSKWPSCEKGARHHVHPLVANKESRRGCWYRTSAPGLWLSIEAKSAVDIT